MHGKVSDLPGFGRNASEHFLVFGLEGDDPWFTSIRPMASAARAAERCTSPRDMFDTYAINGWTPEQLDQANEAALYDWKREATANDKPRFRLYSAAELDSATFELTYYINDILSANEPCALGGAEKSLKTTIMLDMGVSLAVPASHFLGVFPVAEPKRFIMFSGESGIRTLQETTRRICRRAGYELEQLDGFTLSPDLPQLDDVADVVEFEAVIAAEQPDVVAVDPMMLCLGDVDEKAANMFSMPKRSKQQSIRVAAFYVPGLGRTMAIHIASCSKTGV